MRESKREGGGGKRERMEAIKGREIDKIKDYGLERE